MAKVVYSKYIAGIEGCSCTLHSFLHQSRSNRIVWAGVEPDAVKRKADRLFTRVAGFQPLPLWMAGILVGKSEQPPTRGDSRLRRSLGFFFLARHAAKVQPELAVHMPRGAWIPKLECDDSIIPADSSRFRVSAGVIPATSALPCTRRQMDQNPILEPVWHHRPSPAHLPCPNVWPS